MEKYRAVATKMGSEANMMILSTLDDIAWLLNLRGNDIDYNPIFFAYVIFHKDEDGQGRVDLFIDETKVSEAGVQAYLEANNVTVHAYTSISDKIEEYGTSLKDKRIVADKN